MKEDGLFTRISERVTYLAGTWQHMVFWTALILGWLALGPSMHFSDSWQLLSNSPTTLAELYLGLFILVAENHSRKSEEKIRSLQLEHNDRMDAFAAQMERLLTSLKTEEDLIEQEVEALVTAEETR